MNEDELRSLVYAGLQDAAKNRKKLPRSYITTDEVARLLGVSRPTVERSHLLVSTRDEIKQIEYFTKRDKVEPESDVRSCNLNVTGNYFKPEKPTAPITYPAKQVEMIPYVEYNPIKRVALMSHALETAGTWFGGDSLFFQEAEVRVAEGIDELRMTQDDGILISEKFSLRSEVVVIGVHHAFTEPGMGLNFIEGDEIKAGEALVRSHGRNTTEKEFIEEASKPKMGGKVISINTTTVTTPLDDELTHWSVKIGLVRPLGIGDKLLSLTGIKGVVVDVRSDLDVDVVIHPGHLWGSKESSQRGALLKEMESGKVKMFYQPDHLRTEGLRKMQSISVNVWPALWVFGDRDIWVDRTENDFGDVPHVVADDELQVGRIDPHAHPLTWSYRAKKGEIVETLSEIDVSRYDYLPGYPSKGKRTKSKVEIRNVITRSKLARKITGWYLTAVAHNDDPRLVLGNIPALHGHLVTVWREPVVQKSSVQCLEFYNDPSLPEGVIAVTSEVIRDMNGDFDGDHLVLVDVSDQNFVQDHDTITDEVPDLEIKPVRHNLKAEGRDKIDKDVAKQKQLRKFGGARLRASFMEVVPQADIMAVAYGLEGHLKEELEVPEDAENMMLEFGTLAKKGSLSPTYQLVLEGKVPFGSWSPPEIWLKYIVGDEV